MGHVKARMAFNNAKEVSIATAIQAYQSGTFTNIRDAAESQGLTYSTLYGCLKGRQPRQKAHELDQILSDIEERVVVKQIEDMDQCGFPMHIDVHKMALKVLQEREGTQTLDKHWHERQYASVTAS